RDLERHHGWSFVDPDRRDLRYGEGGFGVRGEECGSRGAGCHLEKVPAVQDAFGSLCFALSDHSSTHQWVSSHKCCGDCSLYSDGTCDVGSIRWDTLGLAFAGRQPGTARDACVVLPPPSIPTLGVCPSFRWTIPHQT